MTRDGESFEVLGEKFSVEHFPILYDMYQTSKPNLERQLKSIADVCHEGSISSAAVAFESDLSKL